MVFRKTSKSLGDRSQLDGSPKNLGDRWAEMSKFLGSLPSEQIFYRNILLGAPEHTKDDGWMLKQSKLTFIDTFHTMKLKARTEYRTNYTMFFLKKLDDFSRISFSCCISSRLQ